MICCDASANRVQASAPQVFQLGITGWFGRYLNMIAFASIMAGEQKHSTTAVTLTNLYLGMKKIKIKALQPGCYDLLWISSAGEGSSARFQE